MFFMSGPCRYHTIQYDMMSLPVCYLSIPSPQGGVGGFEGEVSLTAFVLIAMHHAVPLYPEGQDSEVVIHHSSHGLYLNITDLT